jgi:hypothetical protein
LEVPADAIGGLTKSDTTRHHTARPWLSPSPSRSIGHCLAESPQRAASHPDAPRSRHTRPSSVTQSGPPAPPRDRERSRTHVARRLPLYAGALDREA